MNNTDCHLPEWISYPERMIIGAIITEALSRNYAISVYDGQDWTVQASTLRHVIEDAIGTTDTTTLRFRDQNRAEPRTGAPTIVGSVFLVHGNGSDVIADHTDNEAMEQLLKPAMDLAETFSAAGV